MKSVNLRLRKAYYAALTGITYNAIEVKCYYGQLPNELSPSNYIIFDGINGSDISTKLTADTDTRIQVKIFTSLDIYNPVNAVDDIADQVFARLYPNQSPILSLEPFFQMISTKLVSDNTEDIQMNAQLKYIDRTLVFSHRILHR